MQTLYSVRPSDGRILRYDGKWAELGTFQGLETPRLGDQLTVNWFKYKGVLHCAALTDKGIIVGEFDKEDLVIIASKVTAAPVKASWGNTINFDGQICWLEQNEKSTLFHQFNGTVIMTTPVDIPLATEFSPADCELNLVQLGSRLAVLPKMISICSQSDKIATCLRNVICLLDVTAHGIHVLTTLNTAENALNVSVPGSQKTAAADLKASIVGAGVYQDRLITLTADGKISRGIADTRRVLADLTHDVTMRLGRYNTEIDGTETSQVMIDLFRLSIDAAPYLMGSRVFVDSGPHAGVTGLISWIEGNSMLRMMVESDTTEPFPALAANTEFSIGRGVAGGFCGEPRCPSSPGPLIHTFFFDVADTCLSFILGRSPNEFFATTKQSQPSLVARIKGDSVDVLPLKLDGESLNVWSAQARLDSTDSSIAIVYYDARIKAVRHVRYNIAAAALSDVGLVYGCDAPVHLASGNLIGFDSGELDIVIRTIEADSMAGEVQIHFDVFGDDPVRSNVTFFYNIGGGWLPATKSMNAQGVTVFVHALRVDQPTFNGDIQYRATISRI